MEKRRLVLEGHFVLQQALRQQPPPVPQGAVSWPVWGVEENVVVVQVLLLLLLWGGSGGPGPTVVRDGLLVHQLGQRLGGNQREEGVALLQPDSTLHTLDPLGHAGKLGLVFV